MLADLFRSEKRAIQATAWGDWGDGSGWGPTAASGRSITSESSLQLLTVFGCNRFIADGISTLPLDTFRDDNGTAIGVPSPRWLMEPVPNLDPIGWLTQILTSLLLSGNAYLFLDYTDAGLTTLVPLDPSKVNVERVRGRKVYRVDGRQEYDSTRVLHIPGVMFPGADVGLSPVEYARQTIGMGLSIQQFAKGFFDRGAVTSGVIETDAELTPQKAKEWAKQWARIHSGPDKAHLPGVLDGGAHWNPTTITPEQAQFLQTRGYTAAEIAGQMFLIDPTELGIPIPNSSGNLTYANLEQRNERKVQVTYLPWLIRLEKAFSGLMARPRYAKFNVGGLLRGDMLTRFEAYRVGIASQFMVPNEARALEDMAPLSGGDEVITISTPADKVPTKA